MALTKVSGDFLDAGSITQAHLHTSHGITTTHIAEGNKLFFTNARVDSRVGSLSTSDLSEGANLYYTDARARAAISGTGSLSYNSTTGVMSFTMPAQNTSNITEGSNLYYTDARADARIAAADTGDLSEGTNLYYTQARFNTAFTAKSTSDLSEGTNLYYTDARADARVALIVDSAPGTLNTLNELAAALGDDANFSTTVTNSIATKLPLAGGTLTGPLQAQPWLFRSMANQTEYHVLDNGSINGPSWKFRYDGATANRYVDFGYKDGNGTYTAGLKLYNNQTISWRGTDIINSSSQWVGGIASSGYNNSNWDAAYTYSQVGHLPLAGGTLTGNLTVNARGFFNGGGAYPLQTSSTQRYNFQIRNTNNTVNSGYGWWLATDTDFDFALHADGAGDRFTLTRTGNATFTGTITAPIFYDSNDTTYYTNPGSRSNFGSLDLNSGTVWDATTQGTGKGALHLDPASGTDHAGGAITFGASDTSSGTNAQAGIYVRSDGTYGTRMYLSTTDSYASGSKTTIRLEAAGGLYVDRGNFYAPIFYDSNNTGYFLNPSASSGNALKTIGDWRQTTDSWSGEVGGKMQYHSNHWYLQAAGYIHFRNASGVNTFYVDSGGVGYVHNYLTGANSLRAPIFYDSNDTNYYVDPAGTSRLYHAETTNGSEFIHCKHSGSDFANGTLVTTDIPANTTHGASYIIEVTGKSYSGDPPFAFKAQGYLYNNTIINHSGVSYGKPLGGNNQIKVFNHSDNKLAFWWPRVSYWNSFEVRVRDSGGSARNRALTVVNSTEPSSSKKVTTTLTQAALLGHNYGSGSLYSDRLYDQNNTGYYVDAASTSNVNAMTFAGAIDANGGHGGINITNTSILSDRNSTWTGNPGANGKIQYHAARWYIVSDSSSDRIVQFRRDGLDVSYIDNAGRLMGAPDLRVPIYYDSNDTNYYVNPGLTSSNSTSHSAKFRQSVQIGDSSTYNQNDGGWGSRLIVSDDVHARIDCAQDANAVRASWFTHTGQLYSTFGTVTGHNMRLLSHNATRQTLHNGYSQESGSYRAPVFYDSNNTVFYMDPHSTSSLASLNVKGEIAFPTSNLSSHSAGARPAYAIYQEGGAWSPPFPDLCIAMHTGIKLGANASYNGIRFYDDYTMATQVMAVNDSSSPIGASHVYVNNVLQAGASLRAPIFYDSNDTSYYVNPAGLSDFYSIKTTSSVDIAPRWDTSFYVAQSQHYYGHTSTQTMYLGEANHINIRNIADIHGQARAPIYYDRNNTGYYMHPDSTSVIVGLTMAGALQTAGSHTVGSSGTSNIYMGGTSGNHFRFHTTSGSTYFDMNSGNINWRNGSSTRFIFYNTTANMTVYGTITQHSDLTIKDNIVEIPNCINKVKSIRGIYYNRTDFNTQPTKIGVIAQEVEVEMPELVHNEEISGIKSVSYTELTAVLVNAIKEQQTIIDDLKTRLETLENQ